MRLDCDPTRVFGTAILHHSRRRKSGNAKDTLIGQASCTAPLRNCPLTSLCEVFSRYYTSGRRRRPATMLWHIEIPVGGPCCRIAQKRVPMQGGLHGQRE